MNIFDKKNSSDKWKNKYYELLDENEDNKKISDDKEELLCKTIARLCLATTGFNKELDPHLKRIRNQLKKGLQSERLKADLEAFSNALMTMDDAATMQSTVETTLLFDFLFDCFPEHKNNLKRIEEKFEKKEFPNTQYLFIAVNDLIDSIQQIEPLNIPAPDTLQHESIDTATLNGHLLQLLENTEIPVIFELHAKELKNKLGEATPLTARFDETIALLFKIKKHIQSEQQAITKFLTQLTDQLTELGQQASGVYLVSTEQSKKRNLLAQSVSSQMFDLQEKSNNSTTLEPLKQLINTRLADIQQQIEGHQIQEQTDRNKFHHQLKTLSIRINELEQESSHLQDNLNAARQQATRDPLTDLPNRLAYDERITIEIARFQRYKAPLSMLIWDIDLFKQINDNFGHKAGDKTLIMIAGLLLQHCRETDFVSRFGGEEFTMLLSDTDVQGALQAANKIRQAIEKTAFNYNGEKLSITISCGITEFNKNDSAESAFIRADKALYEAKNNGRNQCVIG